MFKVITSAIYVHVSRSLFRGLPWFPFPSWQKESWQTFKETSGYVRPERVNKRPNSMTDIWWWWWWWWWWYMF